jgi:hypothetical protein
MPTETTLNEPLRSGRLFGRERWMVYHPDADTHAPVFKTRKEARENCTRWNRSSCTGHIVIDLEKRPNRVLCHGSVASITREGFQGFARDVTGQVSGES